MRKSSECIATKDVFASRERLCMRQPIDKQEHKEKEFSKHHTVISFLYCWLPSQRGTHSNTATFCVHLKISLNTITDGNESSVHQNLQRQKLRSTRAIASHNTRGHHLHCVLWEEGFSLRTQGLLIGGPPNIPIQPLSSLNNLILIMKNPWSTTPCDI